MQSWIDWLRRTAPRVHARIRVTQTIHALPYAALGVAFTREKNPSVWEWTLLFVVVIFARAYAVALVRLFDAPPEMADATALDETKKEGGVPKAVWGAFATHAAGLFILAAYGLNEEAGHWSWMISLYFPLYALTRHHTIFAHFVFGTGLGLVPMATAIALEGTPAGFRGAILLLSAATSFWASGYDLAWTVAAGPLAGPGPHRFLRPSRFRPEVVWRIVMASHAAAVVLAFLAAFQAFGAHDRWWWLGPLLFSSGLLVAHARRFGRTHASEIFIALNLLAGPLFLFGVAVARLL